MGLPRQTDGFQHRHGMTRFEIRTMKYASRFTNDALRKTLHKGGPYGCSHG
jgi:hypothetical protein